MSVHALVAVVGTGPKPAVLPVLHRFDEVLTNLVGGGFGIPVLAENDLL